MFIAGVLVLVAACNAAHPTDPVSAFDHHVAKETEILWEKMDYNNNGVYDLSDAHEFIKEYDSNGDKKVTQAEFDFHWGIEEPTLMIVGRGLYLEYDDNQDGEVTESDIDAMYKRIDQDGSGVVEKHEFKKYYHSLLTVLFILYTQHIENSAASTPISVQ